MSESEATSTESDLEALKALQADASELEHIENLLDRFNVFETISFVGDELMHSNFLAFLLDPKRNDGLRDLFKFSEDFEDKLYTARVDAGEFDRDSSFDKQKQDLRTSYTEKKRKYLEETDWQYKLFYEMLFEVEKNTPLFL